MGRTRKPGRDEPKVVQATERKLPAAFVKRAREMAAEAKQARHERAKAALEDARAAHGMTVRNLYRLGVALTVLAGEGMSEEAGFAEGFYAMCLAEFQFARTWVDALLKAVASMPESRYAKLGPKRANALLDFAAATLADDTAAVIAEETVPMWDGGPKIALLGAKTREIVEATKKVRAHVAAASGKKPRGRTVSARERTFADLAAKAWRKHGTIRIKPRATKPGAPAVYDVVGLTAEQLAAMSGAKAPADS